MFCELAEQFARASVPEEIVDALRMERMTALQKPSGGSQRHRCWWLFPTIGLQNRPTVAHCCGGCHSTIRVRTNDQILRGMCGARGASVDGGGSVEHYCRLMWGLLEGGRAVSSAKCSGDRRVTLDDEDGQVHEIVQGEGGEQGPIDACTLRTRATCRSGGCSGHSASITTCTQLSSLRGLLKCFSGA